MQPRRTPYSRRYKQVETGAGVVFVPVFDDLDDQYLQWHYQWGIDSEDYEYAQAVWIEAERRGMAIETH